jgi:hypothetical protein
MPLEVSRILSSNTLERYSVGGQVGNFIVDQNTLLNMSEGQMSDANDLLYALIEEYPGYEFRTEYRDFPAPGIKISWREKKTDGEREQPDQGRDHPRHKSPVEAATAVEGPGKSARD